MKNMTGVIVAEPRRVVTLTTYKVPGQAVTLSRFQLSSSHCKGG
jgi:hypothetical protein